MVEVKLLIMDDEMKSKDDEYIYDDFVFKKLTSNNLGEVNPEDICIYATAFPGAMGWGGATQIITKDNNRYMSTLESLDDEKDIEKVLPIEQSYEEILSGEEDYMRSWVYYPMGMGNSLFVRKDYNQAFEVELKKRNIQGMAELYDCWVEVADKVIKENKI